MPSRSVGGLVFSVVLLMTFVAMLLLAKEIGIWPFESLPPSASSERSKPATQMRPNALGAVTGRDISVPKASTLGS